MKQLTIRETIRAIAFWFINNERIRISEKELIGMIHEIHDYELPTSSINYFYNFKKNFVDGQILLREGKVLVLNVEKIKKIMPEISKELNGLKK